MSAGLFLDSFYQADYTAGAIHPIRIQPETTDAQATGTAGVVANSPATGPATVPISAQVSKSTRSLGLHARVIYLKIDGTPPVGYALSSRVRLPCLNIAFFQAARAKGTAVDYLGATWIVTGSRAEVAR